MIEKIEPWIKGKKVLLLGYGREGQSTWRALQKLGTFDSLDIADMRAPEQLPCEGTVWYSGPDYQSHMDDYDVVFKSPGIVLERPEEEYRCQIVSQTEVFFQCFRDQIIGITGTKGKSTVTTLLYHLFREAGMETLLAGNIGIPALDHMDEITSDTKIVFELSCHQLEYMTVSPHIGILVNIHEEHLDHYGTMEKYVEAKRHIFANQGKEDILICNVQCLPEPGGCPSRLITAGVDCSWADINVSEEKEAVICYDGHFLPIPVEEIRLLGRHNHFDIGVAYAVCRMMGMDDETFCRGMKTYEPLPHRLQYVGKKNGVSYYDDSISTICETTIQALETLKNADAVLIGGMDRGIDYQELIDYLSLSPIPYIVLMEATGKRIYEEICCSRRDFKGKDRLVLAEHLEQAVEAASRLCRPGSSCVLSPAAASYGIFTNFEERGRVFSRLVSELPEQ